MIPSAADSLGEPAAAAQAPPLIELEGLGVRLGGRPVLSDLTATLTGRAIGLLGPNGAGKTTLIHTLLGFHPPSAGTARVLGRDVRRDGPAIRARLGYMPEREALIEGMSAVRFVRLMGELSGLPPAAALERAHEALFTVGLGEARYRPLESYSLGMRQLAKLAQAIVHAPALVLLDEPTNGLDPMARRRMLGLIHDLQEKTEVRLIVSSHLLRDVEACCDQVVILKAGRLAAYLDLAAERRTNRRFLDLEVLGDRAGFAEAAGRMGCEVALHGDRRMKLVLPAGVGVPALYRVAAEAEIQVRRLNYRRDSLEDIFMKVMTRGEGTGAAPGDVRDAAAAGPAPGEAPDVGP